MKEKGIEKDKSHKLVSFFSIALVFLTTIFLPRLAFAKEELCSFSTKVEKKKSRGCADMDIEIVEIQR
ncbi:MAG: hypothetical protein GY757_19690 [bacterium]|nr:hypothetical protein [bacterium]